MARLIEKSVQRHYHSCLEFKEAHSFQGYGPLKFEENRRKASLASYLVQTRFYNIIKEQILYFPPDFNTSNSSNSRGLLIGTHGRRQMCGMKSLKLKFYIR